MRATLVVSLVVALAACEDDEPGAPDGLPPVCTPDDVECDPFDQLHVLGTWGEALCRFLLECCAANDRTGTLALLFGEENADLMFFAEPALLSDDVACRRAVHPVLVLSMEEAWLAVADGRRIYDRDAGELCLEALVTGSEACVPGLVLAGEPYRPEACAEMILPAAERGSACYGSGDCVPGDGDEPSTCLNASGTTPDGTSVSLAGTCEPLPLLGEPCAIGGECEPSAFCSPLTATCVTRANIGQSCAGQLCVQGSFCSPQNLRCAQLLLPGSPCAVDGQCASGSCSEELSVCEPSAEVDPMSTEYTFCRGNNDHGRLADYLPGDGRDGGD